MTTILFAHPGAELFGSDRMLLESVDAVLQRGHRAVVALPSAGPLVDELRARGAQVRVIPMLVLRKSLMRPRGWPRLVRDATRGWLASWRLVRDVRPAAVYVNTITVPQWTLVARLRRVPSLSHVHEAEASGRAVLNRVLYAPHRLARRVVVNSEFSRQTIAHSAPRLGRRSRVVYNGVLAPASPLAPRAAIDGELRVAFVGRLSPRKGPDVVVDAARILADRGVAVRIDLLGSVFAGYEWYEQELRERIADAGLADAVTLHGFQSDVWSHLAQADVLVVPSRADEPFGNTAVEGVLALRPVLASDTSGLREATAGMATSTLVPPADPVALADALAAVREDWDRLRDLVETSADRAHERFGIDAYRAAIGDEIESVIEVPRDAVPARPAARMTTTRGRMGSAHA